VAQGPPLAQPFPTAVDLALQLTEAFSLLGAQAKASMLALEVAVVTYELIDVLHYLGVIHGTLVPTNNHY
jgi:hypothetical protein